MSAPDDRAERAAAAPGAERGVRGRALLVRQLAAIVGLEARKTLLRARMLPVALFAFAPVAVLAVRILRFHLSGGRIGGGAAAETASGFAAIYQGFDLRFIVFFTALAVFTYLGRGELIERSLHFYFLAPVARGRVLAGKYLAGVVAAGGLLGASTILQLVLLFATDATTGGREYLFAGPGFRQLLAYCGVTLLAVAAYGAVFLALGFSVRNPMIPAAAIFGWEWLNFLLPAALKRVSVVFYLQALCPVPAERGPFALPADAPSALGAVAGLVVLAALALAWGARRLARIEILYGGD